jgi:hypothetical protein
MANTSTNFTNVGGASWYSIAIDTADTAIAIHETADNLGRCQLLIAALSYNNLAHNLTFESYNTTTATATAFPVLEFDGSIGMLERFGKVIIASKPGEILRVKSSAQPVQYLFAVSYNEDFLKR